MSMADYFYRVSTPMQTLIFKNNPETTYSVILVTYKQSNNIVVEKKKSDMTFTSHTEEGVTTYYGAYKLTQEETKKFVAKVPVEVQVRMLTPTGDSLPTRSKRLSVEEVLNETILSNS